MNTFITNLINRLLGGYNPYAGYVEACADAVAYYKLGEGYDSARYLRSSYTSLKFLTQVEKRITGVY